MPLNISAYIRLMRPPNLITSMADVIAAACIAGTVCGAVLFDNAWHILLLSISSCFLYAGGVVMNDVADFETDAIERPERPLPSKLISKKSATIWAILLSVFGVLCATIVNFTAGIFAVLIVISSYSYDYYGKHYAIGPINMGICRALNFCLGLAFCTQALHQLWWLSLIAIIYIAAITMVSRFEVAGANQQVIRNASILFGLVVGVLAYVAIMQQTHFYSALILIALFTYFLFKPLILAYRQPDAKHIRTAVKTAVIGIIILDACLLAAFMGFNAALILCCLLPVSLILARVFAVT